MDARAESARALGVIRDAYDLTRTGAARLSDLVLEMSPDLRKRVERLKQERNDAKTTEARTKQIDSEIDRILAIDARRTYNARKALIEQGLDPEFIARDYFLDPVAFSRVARTVSTAKSGKWSWYSEFRIGSMLSGPLTLIVNTTGNGYMIGADHHARRWAASLVNLAVQSPDAPTFSENVQFTRAFFPGLLQASRNAMLSWRTEIPTWEFDLNARGFTVAGYGQAFDSLPRQTIPGKLGRTLRVPLRAMLASDEFFKTLAAYTEGSALAYRKAKREGLKGDALHDRILYLTEHDSEIQTQGFIRAKELTFQGKPGRFMRGVMQFREAADSTVRLPGSEGYVPLGTQILPFLQTPAQITKLGLGMPFHPVQMLYRLASGRYKGDAAQGVDDTAKALLSIMVMGAALSLVLDEDEDGQPWITGVAEKDTGERALQYRTAPPLSVRIGDTWYSYARVEPLATTLGPIVTALEEWKQTEDPIGALERGFAAIGDSLANKTFLDTFGDIFRILTEYGEQGRQAPDLARDTLLTPMVPNIIRQPARATDEMIRERPVTEKDSGAWDRMTAHLPYYLFPAAENAPPPRVDLWGREIRKASPLLLERLVSPVQRTGKVEDVSDLDRLILRYNERVERGELGDAAKRFIPRPPNFWYTRNKESHYLSDAQYHRLSRESGQLAAERLLRYDLNWQEPDEKDVERIEKVLADARETVRKRILREREAAPETPLAKR
jgi:hypothetical protein